MTVLGDIAQVIDCEHRTAPQAEAEPYGYSVGTRAVRHGRISVSAAKPVTKDTYLSWTLRATPTPGDLIFSREAPMGEVGAVPLDPPVCLGQRTVLLRLNADRVNQHFLLYYLMSPASKAWIDLNSAGSTVLHLNVADVRKIPIPVLPSLDQQRRVVDLLEDHLSRLDAADAQAKIALRRIDSFRWAVLRRTIAADDTWRGAPVRVWLEISIGGLWGGEPGSDEVDVNVIRVTELKAWGRLDPTTAATRSISERQLAGRKLQDGDLLLEKSGGGPKTPVGRVGLVVAPHGDAICANFMQLMRPNPDLVHPEFLHMSLNAFHLSGGTAPMQTASTNIRNIKASEYLQTEVAVPDLDTQTRLVAQVQVEMDAADRLERATVWTTVRSSALRRSLLSAAFSGRLTGSASDLSVAEEMIGA